MCNQITFYIQLYHIITSMSTCGIIKDVFNLDQLTEWEIFFKKWKKTGDDVLHCHGIDSNNTMANSWFQKNVFNKIKEATGNGNMRSVFGMYAESVNPYVLHDDAYHIRDNQINGQPHISWLVPYKVDGDTTGLDKASTIVFNELDANGPVKDSIDPETKERYFTHCDSDQLSRLSIDRIMHWSLGSIIWWDMRNYHCSGSFKDFKTKEMFVGHTFIPN